MVSHLVYFASFRTRFCLSELHRVCNYLGESAFSSSLSNHKDSINYGHAQRTRHFLTNCPWPVSHSQTMKIDLSTVGAALRGRLFEEPTEGLPYIY
jgi:hypothetical protein